MSRGDLKKSGKPKAPRRRGRPVRSCAVCRKQAPADELLRFAAGPDGVLVADPRRRLPGRGASICWNKTCIDNAAGSLSRTLELEFSSCAPPRVNELVSGVLTKALTADLGLAHKIGQLKSGADSTEGLARRGWATAIGLAADTGEATRRRFDGVCADSDAELLVLPLTRDEIGQSLGTAPRSVLALGRGRMAERLVTALHRVRDSL